MNIPAVRFRQVAVPHPPGRPEVCPTVRTYRLQQAIVVELLGESTCGPGEVEALEPREPQRLVLAPVGPVLLLTDAGPPGQVVEAHESLSEGLWSPEVGPFAGGASGLWWPRLGL